MTTPELPREVLLAIQRVLGDDAAGRPVSTPRIQLPSGPKSKTLFADPEGEHGDEGDETVRQEDYDVEGDSDEHSGHDVLAESTENADVRISPALASLDGFSGFDLANVLNLLFPDETSLARLASTTTKLNETYRVLQDEVEQLSAELRMSQDPEKMTLIQEMISDLLGQMSRIREKATESEAVVRNITKDLQRLDLAKRNLSNSMALLKRLQMLVTALAQLEARLAAKEYPEVAHALGAVGEIIGLFKEYATVPPIARVIRRAEEIKGKVRSQVDADLDVFYLQDPSNPSLPAQQISAACNVIDILDPTARRTTIERYVSLELKEYRRIFRPSDEAGQLDNLPRRFAWFRRMLTTHEVEVGRVFPSEWKVSWALVRKFVDVTRDDVAGLLAKAAGYTGGLTVKMLLEYLGQTLEFENGISRKWGLGLKELLKTMDDPAGAPSKLISAAFEPHMGLWVDAQDRSLTELLAPHRKLLKPGMGKPSPPRGSMEGPGANESGKEEEEAPMVVLPSSTELFHFYAQSLEQCAKLSTGQPLFDLYKVQKKWLRIYAEEVLTIAPTVKTAVPSGMGRKSMDTRMDEALVKRLCLHINTADYCQATAFELETKIKSHLQPSFHTQITFKPEVDLFLASISNSISLILRELESLTDPSFQTLSRTSWTSVDLLVSGPSAYVDDVVRAVEGLVEVVKNNVEQKRYVRNVLDKVCSVLLVRFTNALVRSRPLREVGGEQLLIDLGSLKAFLNKLPGEALMIGSYTRTLTKTTMRLEALLKVIVTPVDPPEGFILNYTLLIGDASFTNFQKILDLKGTPKSAQNGLLDSFLTLTSTKTDLESTSFLSSLDMDPPLTGLGVGGSLVSPGVGKSGSALGFGALGGDGKEGGKVFSDIRRLVTFGLRKETL